MIDDSGMNPALTTAKPLAKGTNKADSRPNGLNARDTLRLREAAADFEAMFVKQMLTAMRKTIPKQEGGLIKESEGEKIFRDMLDQEYAKTTSRSGQGLGLGTAMYRQMLARFGQSSQSGKPDPVPTVDEARRALEQIQSRSHALQAVGQGRVGLTE